MKEKKEKAQYKIPTVTRKQKWKRNLLDIFLFVLPALALFLFLKFVFLIGVCPSASMFPLMNTDSAIIGNRLAYRASLPARGDVIVFRKGGSHLTKRVIGLPGDTVSIQNGIVYINEQPTVETYTAEENSTEPLIGINQYEVPEGCYFVLGDNRRSSNDSRAWERPYVPLEDIEAKVLCVFSVNPFSHGFYYRGVSKIDISETYAGVPMYDAEKVVTVTEAALNGTENVEDDETESMNSAVSSTLPVATIAPEVVRETEATTEEEEITESEAMEEATEEGESEPEESAAESTE